MARLRDEAEKRGQPEKGKAGDEGVSRAPVTARDEKAEGHKEERGGRRECGVGEVIPNVDEIEDAAKQIVKGVIAHMVSGSFLGTVTAALVLADLLGVRWLSFFLIGYGAALAWIGVRDALGASIGLWWIGRKWCFSSRSTSGCWRWQWLMLAVVIWFVERGMTGSAFPWIEGVAAGSVLTEAMAAAVFATGFFSARADMNAAELERASDGKKKDEAAGF